MSYSFEDCRELIQEWLRLAQRMLGDRLVSACIYGSVARGEAKPNSDIDVLLVVRNLPEDIGSRIQLLSPIRRKLRRSKIYREYARRRLPRLISEVALTPEEVLKHPPILLDIAYDGIIIYDRDRFLKKVLESLRRKLEALGAKRIKTKKGWYWILKPDLKFGEELKI